MCVSIKAEGRQEEVRARASGQRASVALGSVPGGE